MRTVAEEEYDKATRSRKQENAGKSNEIRYGELSEEKSISRNGKHVKINTKTNTQFDKMTRRSKQKER